MFFCTSFQTDITLLTVFSLLTFLIFSKNFKISDLKERNLYSLWTVSNFNSRSIDILMWYMVLVTLNGITQWFFFLYRRWIFCPCCRIQNCLLQSFSQYYNLASHTIHFASVNFYMSEAGTYSFHGNFIYSERWLPDN